MTSEIARARNIGFKGLIKNMGSFYVAVDLGATNVRVAVGEGTRIITSLSEETDRFHGAKGVPDQIARMIKTLMKRSGIKEVKSIGIGSVGPLDLKNGTILETPNLSFDRICLVKPLMQTYGIPVKLLNDCRAAALGEHVLGAGRGLDNVVYVTLSTGIGGGAIVNGLLLTGKDGNAGEVGHFTINPDSPLICGCGRRGHWEAYCSGRSLPNYVRLLLGELDKRDVSELYTAPESLFKAARAGDETALWIVRKVGEVNAAGFADVINAYDPEIVSVGGSIALNNPDLILKPIEENIHIHAINRIPPIVITPLGGEAVLYGALILAMEAAEE